MLLQITKRVNPNIKLLFKNVKLSSPILRLLMLTESICSNLRKPKLMKLSEQEKIQRSL